MAEPDKVALFEQTVLPYLNAAHNLARWLVRNPHDAEDVVQEAYLRAFRFFGDFRGSDARAWLLAIVRNTCYTWLGRHRAQDLDTPFDEEVHTERETSATPEALLLENIDRQALKTALNELPVEFREALILREMEGFSYKEIAEVAGVPVGTVMSRLARARRRLQRTLVGEVLS